MIGVLTSDFSVSYDLVRELKARGLPFAPLREDEEIPSTVGVVITTAGEAGVVPHANVVTFTTPEDTVDAALRALSGRRSYRRVVVGVDPGERPGVAVIGDGQILATVHAQSPEAVQEAVEKALRELTAQDFVVRVGHGAPTHRDRVIRRLIPLGVVLEVVDESRSTPSTYRTNAERDIEAAKAIALGRGVTYVSRTPPIVRPTSGELREIQRKSRIASQGAVTISRLLARAVATGRLTLDEAVARQMNGIGGMDGARP